MFTKFKRLNRWLKRNFPRDRAEKRRFRSVAEGLDKAEALDEFDTDLETLSAELHHATIAANRRVARHTSDISHRIGRRGPYRRRRSFFEEEDYIKVRLEEIRQINLKKLNELAEKNSPKSNNGSPRTGMLKFAKNPQSRSLSDISARLTEKSTPAASDSSSISGSDSGHCGSDSGHCSSSISSVSDVSDPGQSTRVTRRPKTPFIDRKISQIANKRHSMYDSRGAGFYQYKLNGTFRSEDDLSFLAPPKSCRAEPIKMHIVWSGIIV